MPSTLFNEQITYLNSTQDTNITTPFTAVNTYATLKMSIDATPTHTATTISISNTGVYDDGFIINNSKKIRVVNRHANIIFLDLISFLFNKKKYLMIKNKKILNNKMAGNDNPSS